MTNSLMDFDGHADNNAGQRRRATTRGTSWTPENCHLRGVPGCARPGAQRRESADNSAAIGAGAWVAVRFATFWAAGATERPVSGRASDRLAAWALCWTEKAVSRQRAGRRGCPSPGVDCGRYGSCGSVRESSTAQTTLPTCSAVQPHERTVPSTIDRPGSPSVIGAARASSAAASLLSRTATRTGCRGPPGARLNVNTIGLLACVTALVTSSLDTEVAASTRRPQPQCMSVARTNRRDRPGADVTGSRCSMDRTARGCRRAAVSADPVEGQVVVRPPSGCSRTACSNQGSAATTSSGVADQLAR